MSSENIGEIAMFFFMVRDQLKIYHFQTKSYSRHIAVDQFVNTLSVQLDTYLETIQGISNTRMVIPKSMRKINLDNITEKDAESVLREFKNWVLTDLPALSNNFKGEYKDLENVQEDILSNINKTLYLFMLN
jgi:hypothetical protein